VFDCTGAPWYVEGGVTMCREGRCCNVVPYRSQVVDALLSNAPERSTTVTLLYERPLDAPPTPPTPPTPPAVDAAT
jgi:hypothetical protein